MATAAKTSVDMDGILDRTELRLDRGSLDPFASILTRCKTAPAEVLVLAILKVDCKSPMGPEEHGGREGSLAKDYLGRT